MNPNKIYFSINSYDDDGDIYEDGAYLHFGETRVKVAENYIEFKEVVNRISSMQEEIEEMYPSFVKGE